MSLEHNPREAERIKQELQALKVHLNIKRQRTSSSIRDLVEFVNKGYATDKLIFPDDSNPFRPKKCCAIS